jgi:peptide chain release factor 2
MTFGGIFEIDNKLKEIAELEKKTYKKDFWNDADSAQSVLKKIKDLKRVIEPWEKANKDAEEVFGYYELATEEKDEEALCELIPQVKKLSDEIDHLEFVRKLSGEDDASPALLTIHSGAGGTESCDWTDMLFRMYCRWMERSEFTYTIRDIVPGEVTGIKSVAIEVEGEFAYGRLRAECGVHRLIRLSPFDSNARRHTSFASVYAYPITEDTDEFQINEDDIRVDTYRASGAGGQHVNKTDSAVRMTHIPTGIVVQCQNERSQLKNRAVALRLLKARVRMLKKEEEEKERQEKLAEKKKIEWGSQIRSYVLHPYNMVKDHRTNIETSDAQSVLDGNIDMFIEGYLLAFQ